MEQNRGSMTAQLTAYARAYHATHDNPKIFDDFLANDFFTEEERTFFGHGLGQSLSFLDPERAATCHDDATALMWYMHLHGCPTTVSRSRYTEDNLAAAVEQGVQQYVILGAGMETFAFRQQDMLKRLQVFEIDHPATQAFKRERIAKLGWALPPQLHLIPVDFAKDDLVTALKASPYDPRKKSFFSWLGVTYYLTREAVFGTLRAMAGLAPSGSTIIFDYLDADAFIPERASQRIQRTQQIVRNVGEPMKAGFDPSALAAALASVGLRLRENLSPADIEKRYFQGRTDDLHASEHYHFACAAVA